MEANKERLALINMDTPMRNYIRVLIVFLAYIAIISIATKGAFLSATNLKAVISHMAVPCALVCALTFLFTVGIDLSLGGVLLLSGFMGAILAEGLDLGYFGLFFGTIGTCLTLILINMLCFVVLRIPTWAGSLALALIYEAIGVYYNRMMIREGATVSYLKESCLELGLMPWIIIASVICMILAYIIYYHTRIGLNLRAVSSNRVVAQAMGINVRKSMLIGCMVGAVFLGLASAIYLSYVRKLAVSSGLGSVSLLFKPMAMLFMSIALERYVNRIVGIAISGFFVMSLFNAMTHMGIPTGTWQDVGLGVCIVILGIMAQRGNKGVVK